jgi:hypothetical protein
LMFILCSFFPRLGFYFVITGYLFLSPFIHGVVYTFVM